MSREEKTIFDLVGGADTFRALVDEFYARVEQDEALRRMFPADLEPGKHYQYLFLMQYFGGPTNYIEERGHPRLRMRHAPYPIDDAAKEAWLGHMLVAIDVVGIQEPARSAMRNYFERAAAFMVNQYHPGKPSERNNAK